MSKHTAVEKQKRGIFQMGALISEKINLYSSPIIQKCIHLLYFKNMY